MKQTVRILFVEDSEDDVKLALRALRNGGFDPTHRRVQTAAELTSALGSETWDAIISDFMMPGFTGIEALEIFRLTGLDIPFLLVSGTIGEETAVTAMKAGASDYLMKSNLARLVPALERELKEAAMRAEHRRATQELGRSEGLKAAILESSLDCLIAIDAEGKIIEFNPASEGTFGWTREQALGKMMVDLIVPPRLRGAHCAGFARYLATGIPSILGKRIELAAIRADGTEFPIELTITAIGTTSAPMFTGFIRDITERELASDRLRESERRFSDMLGNIELVSIMLDGEARITYCNDYFLRLTGWPREKVLGQSFFDLFVPPERVDELRRIRSALLANLPEAWLYENDILTSSGDRRLIRWNNSVLRSGAGDVIGTASIGEDITERKLAEQLLEESETKFRHLIEQADDGIFISDAQGNFNLVNSRGCELLGYTEQELLGMNGSLTYADGEAEFHAGRMLAVGAGRALRFERMVKRKDATTFPAEISVKMLDNGMIQVIFHDITERRSQEKKISRLSRIHAVLSGINAAIVRIRDRAELFHEACRIIVEHGHFILGWIAVLDPATGKLTAVAQAGLPSNARGESRLFDGSTALVPGGTAAIALEQKRSAIDNAIDDAPGEDTENVSDTLKVRRAAIALGAKSVIVLPLIVEGETFGILTLYAAERGFFDDEEIKLLDELAGDVSFGLEFIAKEEKADYLAYYDALTGLANRSLFLERVAQYMRSASNGRHKLAVYLIDLERFKNINDSLGRPAGDALLKQVAEWLTPNVGDTNLVARLGADHFAVVLPQIRDEAEVAGILEKTMEVFLQHPFRLNDAVFRIAAKAGVTVFPDDGTDADTLFRNAEAALKKAKVSGDRYLFYTQRMTEKVAGNLTLENQLRQALDNEEFVLHYQPKVNLASGRVIGAEALIRWNDPRTGLVPPGRFIPILEETGLILEVGRWALNQALKDYWRWCGAGLPAVRVAVNVSPLQLRHRDFIAEIAQAIGFHPGAADGLELEITESLIMEDIRHSIASLEAIRAMGICVAIDDFGTGFSSLSYLARLPVDTLKIDRSFIVDMTAGPEGLALVSAIISMAHALRLKVVAEGVETEEQLRLLRLVGCDEMQGYLFSKPVPADVFEARFLATVAETVTADITHH